MDKCVPEMMTTLIAIEKISSIFFNDITFVISIRRTYHCTSRVLISRIPDTSWVSLDQQFAIGLPCYHTYITIHTCGPCLKKLFKIVELLPQQAKSNIVEKKTPYPKLFEPQYTLYACNITRRYLSTQSISRLSAFL